MINTARIHVIGLPYRIDKLFDYYIPDCFEGSVKRGTIVTVPFGRSNKKKYGIVYKLSSCDDDVSLKAIFDVERDFFLEEKFIGLCDYMKEQYFCSFGEAARCILPSGLFTKFRDVYRPVTEISDKEELSAKALAVYDEILRAGKMSSDILVMKHGRDVLTLLDSLVKFGYLTKQTNLSPKNIATEEIIHLNIDSDSAHDLISGRKIKGVKQINLLTYILNNGSTQFSVLSELYGISKATVKTLEAKNIVSVEKREISRSSYKRDRETKEDYSLTPEQSAAYERICSLLDDRSSHAALLHGITGSGKTAVIKKAIDKVLSDGRKVIMLVPEIALTPQAISVFCSYYGDRVALIHSSLSDGERFDAWRAIYKGEADICIGTRSAIFAPFDNVGLIVIDEEHEHTYKSDMSPKYHARDIARYRCANESALLLLASATPSVESYYKAAIGKYELIQLTKRYNDYTLPDTVITDMRVDAINGRIDAVGTVLEDALAKTLEKGEQAILFVNRRGYNNFVSCPLCGHVEKCDKCSVSYTYHTSGGRGSNRGQLVCHYCGSRKEIPRVCPECSNERLSFNGFGTQKAEENLAEKFPDAEIMRMDADTTGSKYAFDRMLDSFRNGDSDILLGTQMVSKGHDFPNVTLVGVLSADNSMYINDFKANERTFSLLTQVIGRAGRSDKPGLAVIQTYNPEHPVIRYAAAQDYAAFYNNEISLRKNYVFPPFCDIALFTFSSPEEAVFHAVLSEFNNMIVTLLNDEFKDVQILVFGPFEASVYKVNNSFRMRYIIKCKNNSRTRALLAKLYSEISEKESNKLTVSIDINPNNL